MVKNIAKNNEFNFQGTQSRIVYISGTNDAYFNLSFKKNVNYNTEAIVITVKGKFNNAEVYDYGQFND